MTLKAVEFIRRFLLHVLPSGFVRIRHYGFLANRVCREKLALCRALLEDAVTPGPVAAEPASEPKEAVEGEPVAHLCPACGEGRMVIVEILAGDPGQRRAPVSQEPTPERRRSIRPEPSAWGGATSMTHRRRDRPWRVTVDSLSAETRFRVRSPRTAHFGAWVEPRLWHTERPRSDRIPLFPARQCPRRGTALD